MIKKWNKYKWILYIQGKGWSIEKDIIEGDQGMM